MSSNIFNSTIGGLARTLDLRLEQHALSSSNLANSHTPEFKAKRIDFQAAFDRVFSGNDSTSLQRSSGRHMVGFSGATESTPVEEIEPDAWSQDGNSVNADVEHAVMVQNNLLYNATVDAMSRKLAMLEYAASDGGK
ncbi:MAG: flagellar basal body rod protein FlgB [Proteobacteria bacterium]|nr:flagellar basal body rod protein FlgB [Pseudomonadota bacterium]